jgi:hypothetical protein
VTGHRCYGFTQYLRALLAEAVEFHKPAMTRPRRRFIFYWAFHVKRSFGGGRAERFAPAPNA